MILEERLQELLEEAIVEQFPIRLRCATGDKILYTRIGRNTDFY